MAHARLTIALVVSLAGLVACNKPKGSCDRRADAAKECVEILQSTIVDMSKRDCADNPTTHAKGTWSDAPCSHDDAIGGCQTSSSRTWYYPGGRASKIEHVAQVCDGPGYTLLDAKGKKLTGVTREAWPGGATATQVADATVTADPKRDAILAAISKLKIPSAAPSGSIKPTGGKTLKEPAATVYEGDLTALGLTEHQSTQDYPFQKANDLRACALAAKDKKRLEKYSDDAVKRALTWCSTIEYLLVVKVTKYKNAELLNGLQFSPGFAEGYVYAYELPSGTAIGGYSFRAESNKTVTGASHSGTIEKDFREQIEKALNAGLKKASPSAALQFDL